VTHYEERLEGDLSGIRARVRDLTGRVDEAIGKALEALLTGDQDLANETILGDLVVNRRVRKLDGKCHVFVARHLPSAGHLRFVSAVMRLSVALERIGDYAVVIARELAQLESPPPEELAADLTTLGDATRRMLRQAGRAFDAGDVALAKETLALSHGLDFASTRTFRRLLDQGDAGDRSVNDVFALGGAINRLSRVADQAENICEEAIFVGTGEMTKKRLSRVLFVAERDDAYTLLAVAYARKAFAERNRFESAGWSEADGIEPRCRLFMESRGLDSSALTPTTVEALGREILDFEVVVSLQGRPETYLAHDLPFRTVVLEWDVGAPPNHFDQDRAEALLEQAFDRIREQMGRLMEMLRGREVD